MIRNENAFLGVGCFYFVVLLCLGVACPSLLQAQVDTANTKQLNEVQINAKRIDQWLKSPTSVQLIGGKELNRINSLSVADAVRLFSGLQLKDYGGIGGLKTVNVQSMGTNHTAVFYDGIALGNAQNGQIDLGKYALNNLEEISFYIGQNPTLLQSATAFSAGSALYLKTKTPQFSDGSNKAFNIGLKSGSFALINPSFSYSQKLNNKISFNLNGELINANGKYNYRYTNGVYDTTVVRQNADIFAKRTAGAVYANLKDSSNLAVKFYTYNSERGVPGAIVSNRFNFNQRQWDDNFFVQTTYQSSTAKRYQLLVNAKYAYDFTKYLDPSIQSLTGPLDNRFTQQEIYFSAANQLQLSKPWTIALAVDYSFQQLDANLKYFAYPKRHTGLIALATNLTWEKFNIQANLLTTLVAEQVKIYDSADNRVEYTPAVLASWQPFHNPNFRLRVFYKSGFRLPTFNDLYYTFTGNTRLRPELTDQYDLGFTYQKEFKNKHPFQLSLQTAIYYNRVSDKIVAVPTVNLFRWTIMNLDQVDIKGAIANLQLSSIFGLFLIKAKLAYTHERALDMKKTSYSYQQQIPYVPVNSGSLAFFADWKAYSLNYSYTYTGERYSQTANIPTNYIPSWYTHDLAVQKAMLIGKVNYKFGLELNNLLNQHYDVIRNYPMPGRNFKFTLNTNF
jgi:vitamin B12 transporter